MELPTELGILTCLSILVAMIWVPYIVGVNMTTRDSLPGDAPDGFIRPLDPRVYPPWIHRAYRAHMNLLEQFLPFAVVVLILDRVGGFNALTYWICIAFFWVRVAHAVGYMTGWARFPLRPVIFSLGWVCILVLASQVFI